MQTTPLRYFMINKPYGMESQFISVRETSLLGEIDFDFPEGIHAVGRLDKYSEGLLLLTTDKRITRLLFQGKVPHERRYLVKVNRHVSLESLEQLRTGVEIRIRGGSQYITPECEVNIVDPPPKLFPLPIPEFDYNSFTWLEVTLTEGRYHQVRKMVAAVRHRCMRLIRVAIEDMELGTLQPGEVKEFEQEEFFRLLKL